MYQPIALVHPLLTLYLFLPQFDLIWQEQHKTHFITPLRGDYTGASGDYTTWSATTAKKQTSRMFSFLFSH